MVPQGVVYWLKSAVYVSLTNRARGLSLVGSRGPGFAMPTASGFAPLDREPTVDEVVAAVAAAYDDPRKKAVGVDVGRTRRADGGATDPGVTFAGLGDPLLRWECLEAAAARITENHPGAPVRVSTNGLLPAGAPPPEAVARRLAAAGVTRATVALNCASPPSYEALMLAAPAYAPAYHASPDAAVGDVAGASFGDACAFLGALADAGVEVEASRVEAPGADAAAAVRSLALALGAIDVRGRPYFP